MSADFRVGSTDTRCAANFARLGFHHGFGLTVTLPPAIGQQRALELLYTGVTRAIRQVTIVGSREVIEAAVRKPIRRATGLAERL